MKILICNDDGIESGGLKTLAEKLALNNDVLVIAPDGNRSVCSHSLTVKKSVKVTEYSKIKGCRAYAISGYPADCVKVATHIFTDFVPDVVLSGINKGHNLGSDIMYSGTVAIAYEAAYFGFPAFAFSAFSHDEGDFAAFTKISVEILDKLLPFTKKGEIWNVNFPDFNIDIKGIKFTSLGLKVYADEYLREKDGYVLYGIEDNVTEFYDCDVCWNRLGFVTVTPLKYDKCDYEILKSIGEKCIL